MPWCQVGEGKLEAGSLPVGLPWDREALTSLAHTDSEVGANPRDAASPGPVLAVLGQVLQR